MSAYPNVKFLMSADEPRQFPPDVGAEVAMAGRSNSGKSSALNAIVGRKALARTSRTPGRTRFVNFFELEPGRRLVDLPGYGFAAVSGDMRRHWGALVDAYFAGRQSLRGAIVVMDARHPLTPHDQTMLDLAATRGVAVHLLLTKADKLGRGAAGKTLAEVRRALGGAATVQLFSAHSGDGLAEARGALHGLLTGRKKKPRLAQRGQPGKTNPVLGDDRVDDGPREVGPSQASEDAQLTLSSRMRVSSVAAGALSWVDKDTKRQRFSRQLTRKT